VTEARARATGINISADDLGDTAKMEEFAAAQSQLGAGIGRLLASFEAYPQIQSNQNYLALQSQLEGTENRIAVALRDYNEAVRKYNTTIRTFPDTIGANIIHGAEPMAPYSAVTEGAEEAPELDLTSN
jgi:LemA protein